MRGAFGSHPQLELLYDHVLRSAEVVVAAGAVAERAVQRGVSPDRIVRGGGFVVPEDLFAPEGPKLDVAALRAAAQRLIPSSAISHGAILHATGPISEFTASSASARDRSRCSPRCTG